MRARAVGWTLGCLGSVALAAAVLVPVLSPAGETELPLDAAYGTEALGDDVTFLDPATLVQRTGEDVSVSVRVRGDEDSGEADDDTAVWTYDTTTRAGDGTPISTSTTTVCLDRRTAEAVDCAVESVDGTPTDVQGLTVTFPIPAQAQDGMLWDDTLRTSLPVRYVGTERFAGLDVQRWEQVVPEQVVDRVTVPGVLVGSTVPRSPADVVYSATRSLLVEPVSGIVVSTEDVPREVLRAPDGTPGAVLLSGTFRTTEESVDRAVARAREVRDEQDPTEVVSPWWLGGAGVVLLGLGALLVVRGRRGQTAEQAEARDSRPPVPVA
ncbi:porin PorA family protein [Blastococcus sp. URHD0036]|uniref:porin PorA family protein n=1 Tax=Blastococcus sp. URHD0036 TaxID=1380356 RepID=UPI0004967DA4|nr:porin PorA family protein [Blastococcus sp. URHD0036]